jgi:hypothetical protein
MNADLWDDTYMSIDDGRWMAASFGTLAFYEATWQALCVANAQRDYRTASQHADRLHGLICRHREDAPQRVSSLGRGGHTCRRGST